jgi:hypothetical protein
MRRNIGTSVQSSSQVRHGDFAGRPGLFRLLRAFARTEERREHCVATFLAQARTCGTGRTLSWLSPGAGQVAEDPIDLRSDPAQLGAMDRRQPTENALAF